MSKIAKLSRLFVEGRELVFPSPDGDIVIWVQKLSTFLVEQCNHEGRVARARKMMEVREIGSSEFDLFQAQMLDATKDKLVAGLVQTKHDETFLQVLRDLRSDAEWRERIEVLEHSGEQVIGKPADDPENRLLASIAVDYNQEVMKRVEQASAEYKAELEALSEDELRDRWREHYIDTRGMQAFTATRMRYEVFNAMRDCKGVKDSDGRWDHTTCNHSRLFLDDIVEVAALPTPVLIQVQEALAAVTVPSDLARFTDGPASSSESSGPSRTAEGSAASGPTAQPEAPATISS